MDLFKPVPPTHLGQYAGFITRLAAFVIDGLIIVAFNSILGFVVSFVLERFQVGQVSAIIATSLAVVTGFLFYVFYYIGLWMLAGQTLGKALMGVRIVRVDGGRLRLRNAVVRLAGLWLSAILFLGYLLVLVDGRRQALHDKLAGTLVVYSWPENEPGLRRRRLLPSRR
ncbi:MAG TPA: RDD family protein [Anaerolineales bacterium]|nr:RDD family protein [Anaerolineales bacterium]